ncbi:MAG TPA: hypothetical protein VM123_08255, partial [archaeon]|nr:hypothetical protein [archaeon]
PRQAFAQHYRARRAWRSGVKDLNARINFCFFLFKKKWFCFFCHQKKKEISFTDRCKQFYDLSSMYQF